MSNSGKANTVGASSVLDILLKPSEELKEDPDEYGSVREEYGDMPSDVNNTLVLMEYEGSWKKGVKYYAIVEKETGLMLSPGTSDLEFMKREIKTYNSIYGTKIDSEIMSEENGAKRINDLFDKYAKNRYFDIKRMGSGENVRYGLVAENGSIIAEYPNKGAAQSNAVEIERTYNYIQRGSEKDNNLNSENQSLQYKGEYLNRERNMQSDRIHFKEAVRIVDLNKISKTESGYATIFYTDKNRKMISTSLDHDTALQVARTAKSQYGQWHIIDNYTPVKNPINYWDKSYLDWQKKNKKK